MTVLVKEMVMFYKRAMTDLRDTRLDPYPLMSSPVYILGILAVYTWFVLKAGPAFMKNRKPFKLDALIQVYNLFQVIVCGWMAFQGFNELYNPWWGRYNFICEPVDYLEDYETLQLVQWGYVYFALKIIDLVDTVFFVLRKKQGQVTFLHVHHHVTMVIMSWLGLKFLAGGNGAYVCTINSLVHSVMYFYYFLANLKKEGKRDLWWKKHVTQLQLFQFTSLAIQCFLNLTLTPDCAYPKFAIYIFLPQNIFMSLMFWEFYRKKYLSQPKKS